MALRTEDRPSEIGPPPLPFLLAEGPRASAELAGFLAIAPFLRTRRGDGHPVLVLPGFMGSDRSTQTLRRFLRRHGHRAYGWRLGRNVGPTAEIVDGIPASIAELSRRHQGQAVSLVGWSLGGVLAREVSRLVPDQVRQVITLGSPFEQTVETTTWASRRFERYADRHIDTIGMDRSRLGDPIPVPCTAIFTRTDGIVPWRSTVQEPGDHRENIEVRGSHCGLGHNPAAVLAVADRLARPVDDWTPFRPPRAVAAWYPRSRR